VSIRLLDEKGHVIRDFTVQASCGTGCRGDFSVVLTDTFVSHRQVGVLQVFEVSAKDGSAIHIVEIPVMLFSF
jgi:hypothetical protein